MSGVKREAWMEVNCRRSWFTSAGVKPAVRKRSKPRGVLRSVVVVASLADSRDRVSPPAAKEEEEGWRQVERLLLPAPAVPVPVRVESMGPPTGAGTKEAAAASVANSSSVSSSPILQFT